MSIRGISPEILFKHIDNTAAFLFAPGAPEAEFLERLRAYRQRPKEPLTHLEYFDLCLSAHYATVATYVPTDVDNQIRHRLWDQKLEPQISTAMAELTLASRLWNFRSVTVRTAEHYADPKRYLSGHQGEWFSVAVGAYAKHKASQKELAELVVQEIISELREEAEIYLSHRENKSGIGLLKACALIAHNLGDLDRVIDQWDLPPEDPLRKQVYKLGHEKRESKVLPLSHYLVEAGELNKAVMASENHRHYPLRAPKALRRSLDFLLPVSPFLEAWGAKIARHPELSESELTEIVLALIEGFAKLSTAKTPLYGYARALAGITGNFPGGVKRLYGNLPVKAAKKLQEGQLHQLLRQEEAVFMDLWAKKALQFFEAKPLSG